ncbi:MAG: GNAT family N-acetyltransferase [Pseudomonadota bacterium]
MSAVRVRPAIVSDRASLEALQWRASLQNPTDREALLANPDAIMLPVQQIIENRVFVAEQGGKIMGFSAILPREDGNSELDALFVEPGSWRQGIGRALVDHSSTSAKSTGASYLHVVGNPHAEQFYKACGFESFGTERTRFGVGLLMKRPL